MNTAKQISEYALIGDLASGALVHRNGSITWACLPRFDDQALFCSLLGDDENGAWHLRATDQRVEIRRRYVKDTLVLETTVETAQGVARVIDFMPVGTQSRSVIIRIIEGVSGSVEFSSHVKPRMKFGLLQPWTRIEQGAWVARLSPDGLCLHSSVAWNDEGSSAKSVFDVAAGQRESFTLQWFNADAELPQQPDVQSYLDTTLAWWRTWTASSAYQGKDRDAIMRSAITLKALSNSDHGTFVAALTTSLPEKLGGDLNWDYRYTWLRDASFTISALLFAGFEQEAASWRDWFFRVSAGQPQHLHIMYGVGGERLDVERTIPWLSGFGDSQPVRVSNEAHDQFQLGIYGDILNALEHAQRHGIVFDEEHWNLINPLLDFIEEHWQRPGCGIWERRDGGRQYVDSKVMCWVGIDRALKMAERGNLTIDAPRRRALMQRIHEQVCRAGFDPIRNTFTQSYGSTEIDASLLLIAIFGFLPPDDPRMLGTIAAIEETLLVDGRVYRYSSDTASKTPTEGTFAMCGFWLVQAYILTGRYDDARVLLERLSADANDLGLFAEEFDVVDGIAIGNFPQAFSHAGYISAAVKLHEVCPQ